MCFIAAKIQLFPETQKGRMKKSYPTCQIGLENLPCDLAGARTQDPNIKSVVLYLLSYQVDLFCGCKSTAFFVTVSLFGQFFFIRRASLCPDG